MLPLPWVICRRCWHSPVQGSLPKCAASACLSPLPRSRSFRRSTSAAEPAIRRMPLLKYTQEHEWLKLEGDIATVGITEHAATLLGDVVFVQLPEVGATLAKGDSAAVVESVKAASEVYAPIAGEVVEVNQAIVDDPAVVNADPQGAGWFFKLRLADPKAMDGLLDEAAYNKL